MELDEFVTSILSDIVKGIQDAQASDSVGKYVAPSGIGGHDYAKHNRVSSGGRLSSTIVDFDIAVTVEETSNVSGSGGIKVAGIGASIDRDSLSKDVRVSRIQFAVPLLLPKKDKE